MVFEFVCNIQSVLLRVRFRNGGRPRGDTPQTHPDSGTVREGEVVIVSPVRVLHEREVAVESSIVGT